MCAFKFKLEPVVTLKKRKEDERKVALACAKKDLQKKQNKLVSLCEQKQTYQKDVGDKIRNGELDISRMLIYYAYLERLTDEIANHTNAVEQCKKEVDEKRELLLKSSKETKALEKLKEKKRLEYISSVSKAEQSELDETAGRYHGRNEDNPMFWRRGE